MKAMPKDDFIKIVSKMECEIFFEDDIAELFTLYCDDWFINREYNEWELCNENQSRKEYLL